MATSQGKGYGTQSNRLCSIPLPLAGGGWNVPKLSMGCILID